MGYLMGQLSPEETDIKAKALQKKFNDDGIGLSYEAAVDLVNWGNPPAEAKEVTNTDPMGYKAYAKNNPPVYHGVSLDIKSKLDKFLEEVVEVTQKERLVYGKEYTFKKLMEEIGEYCVASLGEKKVTESTLQECVDIIIMAVGLLALEGGNLDFLAEYGQKKIQKWKDKLDKENKLPEVNGMSGCILVTIDGKQYWKNKNDNLFPVRIEYTVPLDNMPVTESMTYTGSPNLWKKSETK